MTHLDWNQARSLDPSSSPESFSALTDVPLFLGYIMSFMLQGILIVQIFIYYISFPMDPHYIKIIVAFVFLLECLWCFFATHAAGWSIIGFGDLFDLMNIWSFKALGPLCGLVELTVHGFYSWRIYQVKGHWCISIMVILLSILQCCAIFWSGTQPYPVLIIPIKEQKTLEILSIWLISSALCDVIIAITLMIMLPRASRLLIKSRPRLILLKVMKVVVETGLITAFSALMQLMFFFLFKTTLLQCIFYYILAKIYSNCMMAALNARLTGRVWKEAPDSK
ncbi:hypothetical protein K435DRAFT_749762 [Dendrothele bispora CBS 962.96]|uniref:DUF6534 domain-containing protein n=1 Tax=Dendrothele bispora (strain CBS 962.96) TaxID=1314807 RepID=A0A4S8MHS3_DENBC|nr:hypothetical protein K435DRAFT_749762 [Dendrothele bispora CBS 962.96]